MSEVVPYRKPVSEIVPVAPSKEADRVAPVALRLELEPVVTVAVAAWPPEVPPPDGSHFLKVTVIDEQVRVLSPVSLMQK